MIGTVHIHEIGLAARTTYPYNAYHYLYMTCTHLECEHDDERRETDDVELDGVDEKLRRPVHVHRHAADAQLRANLQLKHTHTHSV